MSDKRFFTRRQFTKAQSVPSLDLQALAQLLIKELPEGHGFALLTFPLNDPDAKLRYISNGSRESVLKLLKDFVQRQENHDATGPINPPAN